MQQVVVIGSISEPELMLIERSLFECGYEFLIEQVDISPIASTNGKFFLREGVELFLEMTCSEDYELGDNPPMQDLSSLISIWLKNQHPNIKNPLCLLYRSTDFLYPELDTVLLPGIVNAWNVRAINLSDVGS